MITVFIFCKKGDADASSVVNLLSSFGAIHIDGRKITNFESANNFLIISAHDTIEINVQSGIAVFFKTPEKLSCQKIPKGFIGIAEHDDKVALGLLMQNKIETATCGFSSYDTITVSSITEDSAMIGVQRSVKTLKGNIIEPCEFPIKYKKDILRNSLLTAYGILLISGLKGQKLFKDL